MSGGSLRSIIILFAVLILAAPAKAILELIPIDTIITTSGINSCYYADLLGNSTKEIIVQSNLDANIYIYDAFNGNLQRTIPTSGIPSDCRFYDMNNDGRLDLIYKGDSALNIYNVNDSIPLWTSPLSNQDYLYAIGDRNSDGFRDVVIVRREPLRDDNADDTAWVNIYDGPNFNLSAESFFLVTGRNSDTVDQQEVLSNVIIDNLSGTQGPQNRIILFTNYNSWILSEMNGYYRFDIIYSGRIRMLNPDNLQVISNLAASKLVDYRIVPSDTGSAIYAVEEYFSGGDGALAPHYCHNIKKAYYMNADGVFNRHTVWQYDNNIEYEIFPYNWLLPSIGEFNLARRGPELFFKIGSDTLYLVSIAQPITIWRKIYSGGTSSLPRVYHNPALFNRPQVFLGSPPVMLDGVSGNMSGEFSGPDIIFSDVVDLNGDGEDEVLRIQSNYLYVNHVQGEPDRINENPDAFPCSYSLHANYPNPFNAQTIISYDLPKEADVKLEIYDLLGRKVATLAEGIQEAGNHQTVWDGSCASSGIYFYRLKAGDYSDIKKMTLLK
jgi:hypothetical protein